MGKTPTAKPARRTSKTEIVNRASQEKETQQALSLPATYINAIYPMTQRGIVRLAFGEAVLGETVFHSAIVMSQPVAVMLKNALEESLAELEQMEEGE